MISVTTKGFDEFIQDLKGIEQTVPEKSLRIAGKEMGRNLAKNTPVYEGYRDDFDTGQLKAGWFGGRKNANVTEYVDTMPIRKNGKTYELIFENQATNTSGQMFASYVEQGHSQEVGRYVGHNDVNARLVRPFIEGLRFAEKSVLETETMIQALLETEISIELKGH